MTNGLRLVFLALFLLSPTYSWARDTCDFERPYSAEKVIEYAEGQIRRQAQIDRHTYIEPVAIFGRSANSSCNGWLVELLGPVIEELPTAVSDDQFFIAYLFAADGKYYSSYILADDQYVAHWVVTVTLDPKDIKSSNTTRLMNSEQALYLDDYFLNEFEGLRGIEVYQPDQSGNGIDPPSINTDTNNQERKYDLVKVFYATNREREFHTPFFSDPTYYNGVDDDQLNYGYSYVSIPSSHRPGEVERPSYWKLEFRSDPEKHVSIESLKTQDEVSFYYDIKRSVQSGISTKEAIIYIHGYNVKFNSSLYNAGVMAHDMRFKGTVMAFSWPSDGEVAQYVSDRADAERTVPKLLHFLKKLKELGAFDRIHIVAHSMGNDLLTRTMEQWHFRENMSRQEKSFSNIVMAAPDVDLLTFRDRYASLIPQHANRVSLYGSQRDLALVAASENLNGAPRLGSMDPILVFNQIDTIDATSTGRSFFEFSLNHSYYLYEEFTKDLMGVLFDNLPPSERNLTPAINSENKTYYIL